MKLKDLLYLLWKPGIKVYGYRVEEFQVEGIGKFLYARWLHPAEGPKDFESWDIEGLKGFLRPGDLYIDIGAHTGDTSIIPALIVGKEGLVIAVEPNPFVFKVLQKNALLNMDRANILPVMAAITEEGADMVFEYSDPGFCNGGYHPDVPLWKHGHLFKLEVVGTTIQDIFGYSFLKDYMERLRFIKIDAEGYDLHLLKTLIPLVERTRPHLMVEVFKHSPEDYRREIFGLIRDLGYKIFLSDGFRKLRVREVTTDKDIPRGRTSDLFCEPLK